MLAANSTNLLFSIPGSRHTWNRGEIQMARQIDEGPDSPKALNLSRIVFRLLTDPKGILVGPLMDELGIKERTFRNYRQALEDMPEFLCEDGTSLVAVEGRGESRRLVLRQSPDLDLPSAAFAVRYASLEFATQTFEFLSDTELGEGIAGFCQDYVARFRDKTYVLKNLFRERNRKFYYLPWAPKDYSGRRRDVRTIIRALSEDRKLAVTYESKRQPGQRTVLPLTMVMWKSALYLIVMSEDRARTYMMALDRIKAVKLLPETFRYPDPGHYDPARLLEGGFGVFVDPDARPRDFELVFAPDENLQRDVMERLWHASQKFEKMTDGCLRMTFCVTSETEVWPWIQSFGDKVRVVKPAT